MSHLRNGNVPCRYFGNVHVNFKIAKCPLSNLRKCYVMSVIDLCILMSITLMSHVDFKKCPCRPVNFKGQGPHNAP